MVEQSFVVVRNMSHQCHENNVALGAAGCCEAVVQRALAHMADPEIVKQVPTAAVCVLNDDGDGVVYYV